MAEITRADLSHFRALSLGVDMESMNKVLKCAAKDDIIEISASGTNPDKLKFTFEDTGQERVSEYEMKLMNIEEEHLQIPDTDYCVTVKVTDSFIVISHSRCVILDAVI